MDANAWLQVSIPSIVLMEGIAFGLAWKRQMRFAGYALAASPVLLLYFMAANKFEGMTDNGIWFDIIVTVMHGFPLLVGLALLFGARLPRALFWIAWAINLLPLAFLIFMACCFRLEF
jgi:hypothetical protein